MRKSVYLSCRCRACRGAWSRMGKALKRQAHKAFRRQGKRDPGNIAPVSTGYAG